MADELKSNRARVVEALGGDETEAAPVRGKRVANFFYHYKVTVAVGVLAAVLLGFSVWNHFASDKNADVPVICALPVELTANDGREIAAAVRSVQGDGAKTIAVVDMTWYSKFDLENLTPAKRALVDAKENQAEYDKFQSELANSEALLLFISPQLESQIKSALVPLSEIFGEDAVPESTIDDPYAIRLGDTDFYEYFTAAREMPQQTRICVRRAAAAPAVGEGERGSEREADAFAVIRAIADFKNPLSTESGGE